MAIADVVPVRRNASVVRVGDQAVNAERRTGPPLVRRTVGVVCNAGLGQDEIEALEVVRVIVPHPIW